MAQGEVCIYDNPDYPGLGPAHLPMLQWVRSCMETLEFHVINVHGLWKGNGKTDSPERIVQSEKIRELYLEISISGLILTG